MAETPVRLSPKEIRLFASLLTQFNTNLNADTKKLRAQFKRLGETWRDPAYQKFSDAFMQTMNNLERFQRIADETIPELRSLADRADDVHRRG